MNLARVKMLEEFIKAEPGNPFNLYALALEHRALDQAKAKDLFDKLLHDHPDYVPTYYHAGNLYLELSDEPKALQIFLEGIMKAKLMGDKKAVAELSAVVESLE